MLAHFPRRTRPTAGAATRANAAAAGQPKGGSGFGPGGSSPRPLTSGQGDNQGATWAPDGRHIAFQSNRTGRWQVFFMLLDGSATTQVTQGTAEATSPSWSPRLP